MRLSIMAAASLAAAVIVTSASVPAASAATSASGSIGIADGGSGIKQVAYLGHHFDVPSSWPVINLSDAPKTCVRFDRSAVYLGTPGTDQQCPADLHGRTEALLVEPSSATTGVTENTAEQEFTGAGGGIEITVTYNTRRSVAQSIAASAALPAPGLKTAPHALAPLTAATLPASSTSYTGKGFDPCNAPSSSAMSAWKTSSPYGDIGVYIGGVNASCPSLWTPSWVAQQASAGWHFLPLYVGLQGPGSCGGTCATFSSASQGTSAADDAANLAASFGFAPGSVLTYDMEAYSTSYNSLVLGYETAFTKELHARGYKSGFYSSMDSGIAAMVNNYTNSSYVMPDVVDFASVNGVPSTSISSIPSSDWANHQRVNQYSLGHNETWGGQTLNIDQDYFDIKTSTVAGSSVVMASNGTLATYWVDGNGNVWGKSQSQVGGSWSAAQQLTSGGGFAGRVSAVLAANGTIALYVETIGGGVEGGSQAGVGGAFSWSFLGGTSVASEPTAIVADNGTIAVYATASDGNVWGISQSQIGGAFSSWQQLSTSGNLTGKVSAVLAANGTIALYVRTSGSGVEGGSQAGIGGAFGWSFLGGSTVAGDPTAIVADNGTIAVYATASDGNVWGISQSQIGGAFSGWQQLSSGVDMYADVSAVLASNGTIALYVSTPGGQVEGGSQAGVGGAFGWTSLGGTNLWGDPTAIVAESGTIAVYDGSSAGIWGTSQATIGGSFSPWVLI